MKHSGRLPPPKVPIQQPILQPADQFAPVYDFGSQPQNPPQQHRFQENEQQSSIDSEQQRDREFMEDWGFAPDNDSQQDQNDEQFGYAENNKDVSTSQISSIRPHYDQNNSSLYQNPAAVGPVSQQVQPALIDFHPEKKPSNNDAPLMSHLSIQEM